MFDLQINGKFTINGDFLISYVSFSHKLLYLGLFCLNNLSDENCGEIQPDPPVIPKREVEFTWVYHIIVFLLGKITIIIYSSHCHIVLIGLPVYHLLGKIAILWNSLARSFR